jgi:nitrite reductase/ring-hydroxylating ferredoxin subunit
MAFTEVAKISDIPVAEMKRIETNGLEILLGNVNGEVFAIDDRCGHMNTSLSKGALNGSIVECPLHHAQFDLRTGKLV